MYHGFVDITIIQIWSNGTENGDNEPYVCVCHWSESFLSRVYYTETIKQVLILWQSNGCYMLSLKIFKSQWIHHFIPVEQV